MPSYHQYAPQNFAHPPLQTLSPNSTVINPYQFHQTRNYRSKTFDVYQYAGQEHISPVTICVEPTIFDQDSNLNSPYAGKKSCSEFVRPKETALEIKNITSLRKILYTSPT